MTKMISQFLLHERQLYSMEPEELPHSITDFNCSEDASSNDFRLICLGQIFENA